MRPSGYAIDPAVNGDRGECVIVDPTIGESTWGFEAVTGATFFGGKRIAWNIVERIFSLVHAAHGTNLLPCLQAQSSKPSAGMIVWV